MLNTCGQPLFFFFWGGGGGGGGFFFSGGGVGGGPLLKKSKIFQKKVKLFLFVCFVFVLGGGGVEGTFLLPPTWFRQVPICKNPNFAVR